MPTIQKAGRIRLRVGQVLTFIGGLFLSIALALGIRNAILLHNNIKTTGKITHLILDVNGANYPHTEILQFATPDGKPHVITSMVNELPRVVEGQSVMVLYKASNPDDAFNANDLGTDSLKDAIGGTTYLIIGVFLWRGAVHTRSAIQSISSHKAEQTTHV